MLLGIGIAMTMSPMTSAAMNAVPVEKAGIASGVLSMFRMVGGSLGVAVTGAIFQGAGRRRELRQPPRPQDFVDALLTRWASRVGQPRSAPGRRAVIRPSRSSGPIARRAEASPREL